MPSDDPNISDPFPNWKRLKKRICEDFSVRERWIIAVVGIAVIGASIGLGLYVREDKAKNDRKEWIQPYMRTRYQTLKTLITTTSQQHRDEAVVDTYNQVLDIINSMDPDRNPAFTALATGYVAAARLMVSSTYVPIIMTLATDSRPDDWISLHRQDLPAGIQIHTDTDADTLQIPRALLERSRHLKTLKVEFDRINAHTESATTMLLTAAAQRHLIDALWFYARTVRLIDQDELGGIQDHQRLDACQAMLSDSSYSEIDRFITVTLVQDKMLFNTLASLYVACCRQAGKPPDLPRLETLAGQMDSLLEFGDRTHYARVFDHMAQSASVIDTMMTLDMQPLDQLQHTDLNDGGTH